MATQTKLFVQTRTAPISNTNEVCYLNDRVWAPICMRRLFAVLSYHGLQVLGLRICNQLQDHATELRTNRWTIQPKHHRVSPVERHKVREVIQKVQVHRKLWDNGGWDSWDHHHHPGAVTLLDPLLPPNDNEDSILNIYDSEEVSSNDISYEESQKYFEGLALSYNFRKSEDIISEVSVYSCFQENHTGVF